MSTLIARHEPDRKPLPDEVSLKLNGARTVRVKAIDSNNRPLSGIRIYPWLVEKPGMLENANLTGCDPLHAKTDAQGDAVFDWLPGEFVYAIPFVCQSPDHQFRSRSNHKIGPCTGRRFDRANAPQKLSRISGKATWPDSRPCRRNCDRGRRRWLQPLHNGRGRVRTRADGAYEMTVNSEEAYIVTVVDDRWAAAVTLECSSGKTSRFAMSISKLSEGTILHGKVTVGPETRYRAQVNICRLG